jgi:hypothetical protein
LLTIEVKCNYRYLTIGIDANYLYSCVSTFLLNDKETYRRGRLTLSGAACQARVSRNVGPSGRSTSRCKQERFALRASMQQNMRTSDAGWSSLEARWAHNPEVAGSNPAPATSLVDFHLQNWMHPIVVNPALPKCSGRRGRSTPASLGPVYYAGTDLNQGGDVLVGGVSPRKVTKGGDSGAEGPATQGGRESPICEAREYSADSNLYR